MKIKKFRLEVCLRSHKDPYKFIWVKNVHVRYNQPEFITLRQYTKAFRLLNLDKDDFFLLDTNTNCKNFYRTMEVLNQNNECVFVIQ